MTPILATKLYLPRLRPHVVSRPRLIERLNEGLHRKLTLTPGGNGTIFALPVATFEIILLPFWLLFRGFKIPEAPERIVVAE